MPCAGIEIVFSACLCIPWVSATSVCECRPCGYKRDPCRSHHKWVHSVFTDTYASAEGVKLPEGRTSMHEICALAFSWRPLLLLVLRAGPTFDAAFCCVPSSDHVVICTATLIFACCTGWSSTYLLGIGHFDVVPALAGFDALPCLQCCSRVLSYITF